jgi:predicted aconitase with swiveling domain
MEMKGRIIYRGKAEAEALVTTQPISFYGGVDPNTGTVIEKGHELQGVSINGKILVFPQGKGSTVGSYTLYRLKKNGVAPAGMVNRECETIVAVSSAKSTAWTK